MASFLPLDSPKALGKLNTHLSAESYIAGPTPSSDDVVVFKALGAEPEKKWQHIHRWFKHVAFFGDKTASWPAPAGHAAETPAESKKEEAAPAAAAQGDDDLDLFGEETADEKAANEARKAATKSAKPAPVGRSAVILDVKPWGEETDMVALEKKIREIAVEGLEWKAGQLIPLAFTIKKLQIMCHIVDDLVSVDEDVIRAIEALEDEVQSVDIFAFNKL